MEELHILIAAKTGGTNIIVLLARVCKQYSLIAITNIKRQVVWLVPHFALNSYYLAICCRREHTIRTTLLCCRMDECHRRQQYDER